MENQVTHSALPDGQVPAIPGGEVVEKEDQGTEKDEKGGCVSEVLHRT